MSIANFVRGCLDSSLSLMGTEDVRISGKTYPAIWDDADAAEELEAGGYSPGTICSVVISASDMSAAPSIGTTATARGRTWRIYQTRELGRAGFTLRMVDPDADR